MTQEEKKQAQQQLEDGFWYRVQPNTTDGWELMRYDKDFNDTDETAVFRGIGYDEDGIRPEEVHAFDTDRIDAQPCPALFRIRQILRIEEARQRETKRMKERQTKQEETT